MLGQTPGKINLVKTWSDTKMLGQIPGKINLVKTWSDTKILSQLCQLAPRVAQNLFSHSQGMSTSESQNMAQQDTIWFRKKCRRELLRCPHWFTGIIPRTSTRIYCTDLGGLHAPFQCESDFQLECSKDILTYGGSMAGQDDFLAQQTLLGRTPAVHEYACFLLFGIEDAVGIWEVLLPEEDYPNIGNPTLLRQRLHATATMALPLPAHRQYPHPTFVRALEIFLDFLHPDGFRSILTRCFPAASMLQYRGYTPEHECRQVDIFGFSAGSYNGLTSDMIIVEEKYPFKGLTKVGAIACHPLLLPHERREEHQRNYELIHISHDKLCIWWPPNEVLEELRRKPYIRTPPSR